MLHWPSILKTLALMVPIWLLLETYTPQLESSMGVSLPEQAISLLTGAFSVFVLVFFLRAAEPDPEAD